MFEQIAESLWPSEIQNPNFYDCGCFKKTDDPRGVCNLDEASNCGHRSWSVPWFIQNDYDLFKRSEKGDMGFMKGLGFKTSELKGFLASIQRDQLEGQTIEYDEERFQNDHCGICGSDDVYQNDDEDTICEERSELWEYDEDEDAYVPS